MTKLQKFLSALVVMATLVGIVGAATTFMGASINLAQVGAAAIALGQATMASSIPVVIASNQGNLTTQFPTSTPTIAKVGATTTSAQLIASNATRKGLEIDTDCANTDSVAINFGASAAVYASHKQMAPCTSWNPPAGVYDTAAVQVIANTGTQQVRVIEYP